MIGVASVVSVIGVVCVLVVLRHFCPFLRGLYFAYAFCSLVAYV